MFHSIEPFENSQGFVRRRALADGGLNQPPGFVALTALERGHTALEQLLGFAQPLGRRAARAIDVGAGPRVAAIQKERARPHVDRLFVLGGEVVIQTDQQQLLDLRIPIRVRRAIGCAWGVGAQRIGHK